MEKEELVEMINSTINTNGSGAITGEALNLALQAIVETMGTGGGGNTFEKLHGYYDIGTSAWVQTDEEKALNAELYTKWSAMLANDNYFIAVSKSINSKGSTLTQSFLCGILDDAVVLYMYSYTIKLSSDGSILAISAG